MPSSKAHSRLGSAASPALALGPWLTSSGGSGGDTAPDAVPPVPVRRAPPLPLLARNPSQQQQQQLVPIKPPPAPPRTVAIVPVTTAVVPLPGPANNSDRMKELQSVLFPSQRIVPASAAEGEKMALRSQPNENDSIEADGLPRLANLDWLSNNLGQSGRRASVCDASPFCVPLDIHRTQ